MQCPFTPNNPSNRYNFTTHNEDNITINFLLNNLPFRSRCVTRSGARHHQKDSPVRHWLPRTARLPEQRGWAHSSQHGQWDLPTRRGPRGERSQKGPPVDFHPSQPQERRYTCVHWSKHQVLAATICVQSTTWMLDYDQSLQQYFITSGGVEGNPGSKNLK